MKKSSLALALTCLSASAAAPARAAAYDYTTIAAPGSNENNAVAINDSGVVVGYYLLPAGRTVISHGFMFAQDALVTIDPPGSGSTVVSGIASDGSIVGYYELGTTARVDAFILKNGQYTTFGKDGFDTYLTAVSRNGEAAGYSQSFAGEFPTLLVYRQGQLTERTFEMPAGDHLQPNAVNDRGIIVGEYGPASHMDEKGFVLDHGMPEQGPGFGDTTAIPVAVNDLGAIVGDLGNAGFFTEGGKTVRFQVKGAQATILTAINNSGSMVGGSFDGAENQTAFVMRKDRSELVKPAGAVSTNASAINSRGQVVGSYKNSSGAQFSFLASPP